MRIGCGYSTVESNDADAHSVSGHSYSTDERRGREMDHMEFVFMEKREIMENVLQTTSRV